MTPSEDALAKILKNSARAFAGYAASDASINNDESPIASSAAQFGGWQNVLSARIEDLAVALAAGRPEFFVEQVQWTRAALEARGIPPDLLRAKIEALGNVFANQLPPEHSPLAAEYFDRALAEFGGKPAGMSPRLNADSLEERLAATYLLAILEGDRRRAIGLILTAADEGKTAAELILKVLQPAEEELGRMWLLGEINIAEEHFATATTRSVLALLHARAAYRPVNGKTLLAAAVASNLHDLGIQSVADMFESDGWRVVLLGANVPVEDLVEVVEFYHPDIVALSVSLITQLPALEQTIAAIRGTEWGADVKIIVGGYGMRNAPEMVKSLGADCFATNAFEAVACGNALSRFVPEIGVENLPVSNRAPESIPTAKWESTMQRQG